MTCSNILVLATGAPLFGYEYHLGQVGRAGSIQGTRENDKLAYSVPRRTGRAGNSEPFSLLEPRLEAIPSKSQWACLLVGKSIYELNATMERDYLPRMVHITRS
jgi:hypothetical protein